MSLFGGRIKAPFDVKTARLRLVAITPEMLDAERHADGSLAGVLRARLTAEWPPVHWEPHVFDIIQKQTEEHAQTAGWNRYVLLPSGWRRDTLVGAVGGFTKPDGDVEIGYSTLPEFQRRGFATEAVQALMQLLWADAAVQSVSAQTYPQIAESIKIMERCGMTFVGPGDDEGTVRFRRMRQGVERAARS